MKRSIRQKTSGVVSSTLLSILLLMPCPYSYGDPSFGFGFSIASWGPLSLEIGISLPGTLLLGTGLLLGEISFFSGSSGRRHSAGYPGPPSKKVKIEVESVEISSNDTLNGNSFRMKHRQLLDEYDRIMLAGGIGHLQLLEDGSLQFVGVPFEWYLYLHYDKAITVVNSGREPILIIRRKTETEVSILLREGEEGEQVTELLFGTPIR